MSARDSDNIYASEELETTSEEDLLEIVRNLMARPDEYNLNL